MGKQLKAADILGELKAEEGPAEKNEPRPAAPARRKPKSSDMAQRKAAAEAAGQGKPSPYQADLRAKLRKKTQMNFASVPEFVEQEFERLRNEAGMNKREFFYHLLRERGADIPPYDEMDGRKL